MLRLLVLITTIIFISCDNKGDFEVIGVRDHKSQFVATVYTTDTNWIEMEQFAKKLIDNRHNKSSTTCYIGFYNNKNVAPKFDSIGNPIVNSKADVYGHFDYLIAVYDLEDGLEIMRNKK